MANKDFLATLKQGIFLFDGGLGTQLQDHGLAIGEAPEKWNLDHPEIVEGIHRAYSESGAMAITTNSFGASPWRLKKNGMESGAYEVNKAAARLAARAANDSVFVAGSVGPTGAILMMGEISEAEMLAGFETQISGLVDGGAEIIIVETMSDIEEIKLAIKAAKTVCRLPVIASMTFEPGLRGFRTMMGVDILTAVSELEIAEADVVGTNCGIGIDRAIEIVVEMRRHTSLPILAQPNAGLPKLTEGGTTYVETPEIMASKLQLLIDGGARIVGGCCGTTPRHIEFFRKTVDSLK